MNLFPRLLQAALKKNKPLLFESALLPATDIQVEYPLPRLDAAHCHRFHEVVGWQDDPTGILHPCFLHTHVFQQHMQLMLDSAFPFALLGLVHKSNTIQQFSPLTLNTKGLLTSKIERFVRQPRGISCIISSKVTAQQATLWRSEGEFLCIDRNAQRSATYEKVAEESSEYQVLSNWLCEADLGRQYARTSGDFNPIHLARFSAKLFGFKRAIAHGMWTKARCISQLQEHFITPNIVTCAVGFKQPLFLPAHVDFSVSAPFASKSNLHFQVTSERNKFNHLQGQLLFEDGQTKQ